MQANMDTPHIIHVHGRYSPPSRLDPTPHATKSTLQQPHGPEKIMRRKPKLLVRLARYHPFGEGHEQARSEHKEKPGNTQATATAAVAVASIHTLHTAEILQPANGGREEEARATTLCMAWHAQQETSSCATIPTDTGRRGHSASTTSFAAVGMAMRVQYKQGQTAKER